MYANVHEKALLQVTELLHNIDSFIKTGMHMATSFTQALLQ